MFIVTLKLNLKAITLSVIAKRYIAVLGINDGEIVYSLPPKSYLVN